jgi:hypothetical protein
MPMIGFLGSASARLRQAEIAAFRRTVATNGYRRIEGAVEGLWRTWDYPREFRDTPSENAFCLVAPIVLLRDLAIFAAGIFLLARPFKSRISPAVQSRLFAFLAITPPSSDELIRPQIKMSRALYVNVPFGLSGQTDRSAMCRSAMVTRSPR